MRDSEVFKRLSTVLIAMDEEAPRVGVKAMMDEVCAAEVLAYVAEQRRRVVGPGIDRQVLFAGAWIDGFMAGVRYAEAKARESRRDPEGR